MNKIVKLGVAAAVFIVIGVCFAFYSLYQRDVKALTDFVAAYQKYDQAVKDFSRSVLAGAPAPDDLARKADEALIGLNAAAAARISSLIKYEKELMSSMGQTAELSGKEMDALRAYQKAVGDRQADPNASAKVVGDWTSQRKAAYARFRELAELKGE